MNRTFAFGIAMFFAVVGIALVGGDNTAVAGHGCHGCDGGFVGCDGGCGGGCHGGWRHRHRRGPGLLARLHARKSCCGQVNTCCGEPACCEPQPTCCAPEPVCCEPQPQPTCCGSAPVHYEGGYDQGPAPAGDDVPPPPAPEGQGEGEGDEAPAAPSAKRTIERAPFVFRAASFRR